MNRVCNEASEPHTCSAPFLVRTTAWTSYVFSAKGAVFISSLGQRPRDSYNAKPRALKARFIPVPFGAGLTASRRLESRFQRWSVIRLKSWGDAPGWDDDAPLALNRSWTRGPALRPGRDPARVRQPED